MIVNILSCAHEGAVDFAGGGGGSEESAMSRFDMEETRFDWGWAALVEARREVRWDRWMRGGRMEWLAERARDSLSWRRISEPVALTAPHSLSRG